MSAWLHDEWEEVMDKRSFIIACSVCACWTGQAQQAYFVDGYHGGIYGHYPVSWYTQFMIDQLEKNPDWRICLEIEPETWDTVKVRTPQAYELFRQKAIGTQVEFTNPTYAQPYGYNISGESLIRQFQYGMRKIRTHFPEVRFLTYSAEEPCFTSCLPQLLKQFGFRYAVLKCPDTCWGGYTAAYGGELVNWIGSDGTSLPTVPRYACENLEPGSTWQTTAWRNSDAYLQACRKAGIRYPVGMCFQDAGWKNGPWLGSGENGCNRSIYTRWTDYIEQIARGGTNDNWHFSQEDMHVNLMWGSQVLQRIARQVRRAENRLVQAEKIAAMMHLMRGYTFCQEKVDEAWRTLMLAQHHDSWIVPYNDLNREDTWAQAIRRWTANTIQTADNLIREAMQSDADTASMPEDRYLYVYNTLATPRREVVIVPLSGKYGRKGAEVYDGEGRKHTSVIASTPDGGMSLLFEAEVPAFGYTAYRVKQNKRQVKIEQPHIVRTLTYTLENDQYKIVFDLLHGGAIKQLIDKKEDNHNVVSSTAGDAFNTLKGYFYEEGKFRLSTETPARLTVLKNNAFEQCVRIEGEIASHPFTQEITLIKGSRRIDVELTVHWKHNVGIGEYKETDWRADRRAYCDDRFKLRVLFPTCLESPRLSKDAPFDVCESRLDNTFFNRWSEIKHNVILHWTDLSEPKDEGYGLALLTDHTTSYSYGEDEPLALTAQYSGGGLWGRDYGITQPLHITYALIPHRGQWEEASIPVQNDIWSEPLLHAWQTEGTTGIRSLIAASDANWQLSAVQMQGDKLLVRLFNASRNASFGRLTFHIPVTAAEEIDLNGDLLMRQELKVALEDKTGIHVSLPRFGLKTYLLTLK